MDDKPVFQIKQQHAKRDIYNIGRDLNISQYSSAEEMMKLIDALKYEINKLSVGEKDKEKINKHLENATTELENKSPNKNSIAENIKQINEILKEAKTAGESLKGVGILIAKAAVWLGTSAALLGWHF